jgi:hypothetical protein
VIEPTENKRTGLVVLVLLLLTLAIYWPVQGYDFVQYDDPDYVFENQTVVKGITPYGLMWSFVDAHAANWHPVTWISHMLDCQFFGLNPGAHHLVNLLLHCSNCALLFLFLRTTTSALWPSLLVAALFAWHPLRVESVAWISERKDVLSGFFFMLTLLAYARYARTEAENHETRPAKSESKFSIFNFQFSVRNPSFWFPLTLAFFTLGLLSKPMLVTVPAILLLLDYWPLKRIADGPPESHRFEIPWPLIREKIPFFLLCLMVALITPFAQKTAGAVISLQSEGIPARLENSLAGYLGYLVKFFWPHDLSFLYLRPSSVPVSTLLIAALVLLAISVFVFKPLWTLPKCSVDSDSRRHMVVGWFWYLIMVLPVCGLAQAGLQSMADRYTYLPMIGVGIMLAWTARELAVLLRDRPACQHIFTGTLCALLLVCVFLTRQQIQYWQNTETLMDHALQIDPNNYVAHQNLGVYYSSLGMDQAAREHRQRFRELDPALHTVFPTPSTP